MADDDDRPRDAGSAADPARRNTAGQDTAWADASAPDDISELARDVRAYHREQRARRRHEKYGRFLGHPTSEPLTLLGTALVLAAIVAAAITLVQPKSPAAPPSKLPLASATAVAVPGGLLPRLTLTDGSTTFPARDLRPAVLALTPQPCHCNALIRAFADQASAHGLNLDVIAPTPKDAEAAALAGTRGAPPVYYDTESQLQHQFSASGLTLVVVDRDGTIAKIVPNVKSARDVNLPAVLERMLKTNAAAS